MDEIAITMPEDTVADAVREWAHTLLRLREPLRPSMLTDAWIAGLVAARVGAAHVTVKEWGTSRWPSHRPLPYVLRFPCPLGHRTPDRRDDASVSIIIEENGWFSLDPESQCPDCTAKGIRDWLLLCPRCEAGEESERHDPDHWALDVFDIDGDHDASPLSWVLREFGRLAMIATARWWLDHTEEALNSEPLAYRSPEMRERLRAAQVMWAQGVIDSLPKPKAKAKASKEKLDAAGSAVMTVEEGAVWLDTVGVPVTATQREALRLTESMPERPSKQIIEKAVTLRKSRATET